jgi:hypothetical protein
MRDVAFLCARRVCHALRKKYKRDDRHAMAGLLWKGGKWVELDPRATRDTAPKSRQPVCDAL